MSFLFGRKPSVQQLSTQSPEQQDFFKQFLGLMGGSGQGFGQSLQYLQQLLSGDPSATQAFEAPHLRQFQEQTIPQLTERLTSMGAGGGRSSGAAQAFGQAGAGLQENLAALRSGLQSQAAQQLMNTFLGGSSQALGTRPFGFLQDPGDQGFLSALAPGIGMGLGQGGIGGIAEILRSLFGRQAGPGNNSRIV